MEQIFTTKGRNKAFDKLFKEKILPFFLSQGFTRHTKTSKRLFKEFENQLSVFLFFEYKTFGSGFYDLTIAYFDSDYGSVQDDKYLAMAKIKCPTIEGQNVDELALSTDEWLIEMQSSVIPFIETHNSHKNILENTDRFYISGRNNQECLAFLKSKSQ